MLNLSSSANRVVFYVLIVLLAPTTQAQDSQPLFNPELPGYKLYGIARQTELGQALFYCALYLQNRTPTAMPKIGDANSVLAYGGGKVMEFRAAANIGHRSLSKGWVYAIAVNNSEAMINSSIGDVRQFSKLFSFDIKKNDNIRFHYEPESNTTAIYANGISLGKIENENFFKLLLNMWLGEVPPDSDFKNSILGNKVDDDNYYNAIKSVWKNLIPDSERIAFITTTGTQTLKEQPSVETKTALLEQSNEKPVAKRPKEPIAENDEKSLEQPAPKPLESAKTSPPEANKTQQAQNAESLENKFNKDSKQAVHKLSAMNVKSVQTEPEIDQFKEELIAYNRYVLNITRTIDSKVKYPHTAFIRKQEGTVEFDLIIDRDGEYTVQDRKLSEFGILNRAARKAIDSAAPFPEIPIIIKQDTVSFSLPIKFTIEN